MKKIFFLVFGLGLSLSILAQEGATTETKEVKKAKYTKATFKSTRLINFQTTEMISKGNLQFMIAHHFGYLWNSDLGNDGGQRFRQNLGNFFGLNSGIANTYLSFDYSPLSYLNIGIAAAGRMRFEGFFKLKLLRQQTGLRDYPVNATWYSMASISTSQEQANEFIRNRWAFANQLLISRKFSDNFSLQLMPTWIHYNLVPYGVNNSNEIFGIGIGGRYKLNSKKAINFEYSRQLNMYKNLMDKSGNILNYTPDLLSLGLEFNTGGHVFEFFVGNTTSNSIVEQLVKNTGKIKEGKFAFGFHLNRGFGIGKQ